MFTAGLNVLINTKLKAAFQKYHAPPESDGA